MGHLVPRGSLLIFCPYCRRETTAVKRHGPLPGSKRCAYFWWNVCGSCDAHFPALPPGIGDRRRTRSYERRSRQIRLFDGAV